MSFVLPSLSVYLRAVIRAPRSMRGNLAVSIVEGPPCRGSSPSCSCSCSPPPPLSRRARTSCLARPRREAVGLSSPQLARLAAATNGHIESGIVPGAVILIARQGKIAFFETFGFRDRAAGPPPRPRRPLPARLDDQADHVRRRDDARRGGQGPAHDPVSRYFPEMAKLKVGVESTGRVATGAGAREPRREMTVQDLLRHTSGLTYGIFANGRWGTVPQGQGGWPRHHERRARGEARQAAPRTIRPAPVGIQPVHRRARRLVEVVTGGPSASSSRSVSSARSG